MDYRQSAHANESGRRGSSPARRQARSSQDVSSRSSRSRNNQQDASSRRRAEASFSSDTTSAVRSISTRPANGASSGGSSRPAYEQARARRAVAQTETRNAQQMRVTRGSGRPTSSRSSLRRETVSSFGYEPGQSSRPFSYSEGNPIQEGFSLGIDSGEGKDTAWRSRGRRRSPVPQGRDWRPIAAIAAGIVVVVVIISMIFGH